MSEVRIIEFEIKGRPEDGYLSIAHASREVPFNIERIFLTSDTPPAVKRGGHAHHQTEMVLIAAAGTINVQTVDRDGRASEYVLDSPFRGLYLPKMCWHVMSYSENAVQVVLASTPYDAADYIRDYAEFARMIAQ